ncbi:septum formation family protein [Micromonospora sp. KC723]|uniref:septum formation family protein n=1 Tax=Micromonospora sp. KC723 TaxID=2530381 RepID=UPI001049DE72|nr:septum formation family protein [Micromonospora sp. KC723]TDB76476.1 hypothetical protein E1165_06790 [Micromonospora sp. KC723]
MRRWTALAPGALTALALAACGAPAGLDTDLTDDWPSLTAPRPFVPDPGVCHPGVPDVGHLSGYQPVDCSGGHRAETLHVGTLTGAHAAGATPPSGGSAAMRNARAECDREVHRALGGDWRSGRLSLSVVLPSPRGWTGGARWFRCDLSEVKSIDDPGVVVRTGSLRGALTGATGLRLGCFEPRMAGDGVTAMTPVSCTTRHHVEFVGVWQATGLSYARVSRGDHRVHQGCRSILARYTGIPDNGDLPLRTGSIFYHPTEREWRDGDRGVRCFLWADDRPLTRSLNNAGPRSLPVR